MRGDLARRIALSTGPTCQLLTGFSGSGKSSELLRLRARLEGEGYLVVYLDGLSVMELSKPIAYPEVLIQMGLAVEAAIVAAKGKKKSTVVSWAHDFGRELKALFGSEVTFGGTKVEVLGQEIGFQLRSNDMYRDAMRAAAGTRRSQFLEQTRLCS